MSQKVANQPSGTVAVVDRFKGIVNHDKMKENLERALGNNKDAFAASMIELFSNDKGLQKCDPQKVAMEAFKAATLKLPLSKSMGFAYVVPYKNEPTFIIGYKGLIQLAQRTGQYKYINADVVYEGELKSFDKLTGAVDISGMKTSDNIIGYFAHIETVYGFSKTSYWTKAQIVEHMEKYSPSHKSSFSPWHNQFDSMAIKTVLRHLISRYGIMTIEFGQALEAETETNPTKEAEQKANSEVVDFEEAEFEEVNEETGEVTQQGDATQEPPKEQPKADPGF
ncbi:MAG: recombinase RecT [Synergistaceae bacterium]